MDSVGAGLAPALGQQTDVLDLLTQLVDKSLVLVGETEGMLRYKVSGGSIQISFVDEKFVASKKLRPELAGTVLEIVLQHEHSSDTAESMKLLKNRDFIRDDVRNITVYRNIKDGVVYTFIDGTLKTTRHTFADSQLGRARR